MTFLVTGATGTVGREVINALLEAGETDIRALTRNPETADLPEQVDVVRGDLADPVTVEAALNGVDAAHFITFAGEHYAPLAEGRKIVELAEAAGIRRVTVLGGRADGELETALADSGIEMTRLNPVEFMSNTLMWWAAPIKAEGVIREPFGDRLSAMVHPADIGAVAAKILIEGGHDGQTYTLTGPDAVRITDKVKTLGEAIGQELAFIELTEEQARSKWQGEGMSADMIEFLIDALGNTPEEGYTVSSAVMEITGRPARTFAQWAAENADAFRK